MHSRRIEIEAEMSRQVLAPETVKPVYCLQCNKLPGFITACGDADEVYAALQCDCKQTPYYRSRLSAEGTWHAVTFSQTPKEAYEIAIKESPEWITIYTPSHAR
ncbi:MAG TPA: hypothetical protein VL576_01660 [Candidatus Paceibacterota bacterium]|nr:hypothetical protein [Candidatus Paceibacterota bacterium]